MSKRNHSSLYVSDDAQLDRAQAKAQALGCHPARGAGARKKDGSISVFIQDFADGRVLAFRLGVPPTEVSAALRAATPTAEQRALLAELAGQLEAQAAAGAVYFTPPPDL